MSAECSKCGTDIVYPAGTWPIGECPVCKRADPEYVTALEAVAKAAKTFIATMGSDYSEVYGRKVPRGFSSDSNPAAVALADGLSRLYPSKEATA